MRLNKKKIKHLMIDTESTNKKLSDVTGVSRVRISNIINGDSCSFETAIKIANALNADVKEIIDFEFCKKEKNKNE